MTQAQSDTLGLALAKASGDPAAEAVALRALSQQSVLVILRQSPGPGDAAPERNLVQWHRATDDSVMVPVFTDGAHVSIPIQPPAQLVRVPVRVLVTTCGSRLYVINPLSPAAFELNAARFAQVKGYIEEQGHDSQAPSLDMPWAFRPPSDAFYPVAYALASWFVTHGRVDEAYLYELDRMGTSSPQMQIVLGLNEPVDLTLVGALTAVALQAGAPAEAFVVRFLPDEPSHRAGIERLSLSPFYRRSQST